MRALPNVVPLFGPERARSGLADTPELLLRRWGKVKALAGLWWSGLGDDDLAGAASRDDLARVIQQRFGRSREEAEFEVSRFLLRVERTLQG